MAAPANEQVSDPPGRAHSLSISENTNLIYFVLHTTGFEPKRQIVQILARGDGYKTDFICFVKPTVPIEERACQVNGLSIDGEQMYLNNEPVNSFSIQEALEKFLEYLGNIKVVLLTHNGKTYQCPILHTAALACELQDRFDLLVEGFVETLQLCKCQFPGLESHTLRDLYEKFGGHSITDANNTRNVQYLQYVMGKVREQSSSPLQYYQTLSTHSFSMDYVKKRESWKPVQRDNVVSDKIAIKAAENGVGFNDVKSWYAAGGNEATLSYLRENVTKKTSILDKILAYVMATNSPPQEAVVA